MPCFPEVEDMFGRTLFCCKIVYVPVQNIQKSVIKFRRWVSMYIRIFVFNIFKLSNHSMVTDMLSFSYLLVLCTHARHTDCMQRWLRAKTCAQPQCCSTSQLKCRSDDSVQLIPSPHSNRSDTKNNKITKNFQ